MESLIDSLSREKKELEMLQPEDRLSLFVGMNRAVNAIAMSAGGWQQFMSDTATLEKFDKTTLKNFFDYLRREAIQQLEFDLKVLTEHANIISTGLPLQVSSRLRGAYG